MDKLAVRNYRHQKKFFYDEDFLSLPSLILILNEVLTGESDLTNEGKIFLEKNYGYSDLAELIMKNGGLRELKGGKNVEAVEEAIKKIEPMGTRNFIDGYPKVFRDNTTVVVKLTPEENTLSAYELDLIVDVAPDTDKIVGIEVLNLKEQTGVEKLELEDYEARMGGLYWAVSYEPIDDVAYIGFKKQKTTVKSKQASGKVFLNEHGRVVRFEVKNS